jgi:DNA-binding MarR family transcriptional regulator
LLYNLSGKIIHIKMTNDKRTDSVEHLVKQWRQERPDLDAWPSAIAARILRLARHLRQNAERALAPIGLSWETFEMLAALRRSGAPYAMNPTALYKAMLLTSGAMTNRLDRAEQAGVIKRADDPDDRRGTIVRLTPKGKALADEAIELYFNMVTASLGDMSVKDRAQFTGLLSSALMAMEATDQEEKSSDASPAPRRRTAGTKTAARARLS